jgi:hypothetical protein
VPVSQQPIGCSVSLLIQYKARARADTRIENNTSSKHGLPIFAIEIIGKNYVSMTYLLKIVPHSGTF